MVVRRRLALRLIASVVLLFSVFTLNPNTQPEKAAAQTISYWDTTYYQAGCWADAQRGTLKVGLTMPQAQFITLLPSSIHQSSMTVYHVFWKATSPGNPNTTWFVRYLNKYTSGPVYSGYYAFRSMPSLGVIGGGVYPPTYYYDLEPGLYAIEVEYSTSDGYSGSPLTQFYGPNMYGTYFCTDKWYSGTLGQADPVQALTDIDSSATTVDPAPMAFIPPAPRFDVYLPLSLNAYNPAQAVAPVPTPTPQPTNPPLPTPGAPSTTSGMGDPGFESGPGGAWTEFSSGGYDLVMNGQGNYNPYTGSWMGWLGGANNELSTLSQTLSVPITHPYLSFYSLATSQEEDCRYDKLEVLVNEYVGTHFQLCEPNNHDRWTRGYLDLSAFAGTDVELVFRLQNDSTLLSSLFLDDLSFESGVVSEFSNPTPAPTPTPQPTQPPTVYGFRNPGFELGDNGDWNDYSKLGYGIILPNSGSHSGSWLTWLGGVNNEVSYIEQSLWIPPAQPYLTYWGWISSEDSDCTSDVVSILANSTPIFSYNLCNTNNSSAWGTGWVNLTAYMGIPVTLRIQVTTDITGLSSLYVDDFAFASTPPTTLQTAEGSGAPFTLAGSVKSLAEPATANTNPVGGLKEKVPAK